ncbi:MAG: zf-HC2 domain-containing protein, partial [Clostridia bacterium]|nr:zf-HC2 domain-containing protein [Clostridia bacterium]
MTCELDRSQLSAYVDQELSADQRAAVEAHLATCSECCAEFASLGWLVQKLRALPEVEPPDGFREALRRRLLAEADAAGSDGPGGAPGPVAVRAATLAAPVAWWRRTAPVAAAAVVALAVGFGSGWALWG